ncbi:MAG: 2-hydroxyacyl-CoA dehydratase [Deltaproteobacteria bacterium]|nr:2-hydroxyacyl-CoA dehydratase [Deltaproteobacteria bacterium]
MTFLSNLKYYFMKDVGAPVIMGYSKITHKRGPVKLNPGFNPPLKCRHRLREIMARHYFLSRYAPGAKPVAWVTSGAPVDILRAFDFYTVYPENHGALCGAQKMGSTLCEIAEAHGYHQDLCAYARIDLGHYFSGKTPAGRLPKPDLLFASNNICQTVVYWYKALAHYYRIPLILFDTPYHFEALSEHDFFYMVRQLEAMIPKLEQISGKKFEYKTLQSRVRVGKKTSFTWGQILGTMTARPAPMTIFDAFIHLAPVVSLRGLPVALDYYQILLAELQERVEKGIGAITHERKRLMWDNIAIWYKVRDLSNLFASHGMNFVTDTYTTAWAETNRFMDEQDPFASLAKVYSQVILNKNLNYRLQLMERLIREFQVDGLVIHSARSCKPYSVGQYDLKRILMERLGISSVIIEADIADSRVYAEDQTRIRLDAFFESLEE